MEEGEGCIHSRESNVQEVPQAGSGHRPHCASQSGRRVLGRDQLATAMQAMPRHQVGKRSALAKGVGVPRIYWVCGYIAAVYFFVKKYGLPSEFGKVSIGAGYRASRKNSERVNLQKTHEIEPKSAILCKAENYD
jgi:hypothetical protein